MRILITGGAGFIGCNLADAFSMDGHEVVVVDNLSRPGSAVNLDWLRRHHPGLRFACADVRDAQAILSCFRNHADLDAVIHLASQVALTTSIADPRLDFEVNAFGTFNVLEAVRTEAPAAVLAYASTNKVYGALERLPVVQRDGRYELPSHPHGIPEEQPLDLHSPYACSKGAGELYVRDYGRVYGLHTIILRQSCIYGPHQFGIEDQGWVAWFVLAALSGRPITVYGDGRQVRDVLAIGDLIRAYRAVLVTPAASGETINVGGGPANTLSVWTELGPLLERLSGRTLRVSFADWRCGDQRVFVSDIRRARRVLGWTPHIPPTQGIEALCAWVQSMTPEELTVAIRPADAQGGG